MVLDHSGRAMASVCILLLANPAAMLAQPWSSPAILSSLPGQLSVRDRSPLLGDHLLLKDTKVVSLAACRFVREKAAGLS